MWVDVGRDELERHDYSAWTHRVRLENLGPIRGFEGLRHTNENVVNWEPWDKFTPDGEVSAPDSPPVNPSPIPTPAPEPEHELAPNPEPEPKKVPMAVEQGEEEENLIEIDSDSKSESSGFDSDRAP
ncbi:hypothetical protein NL676_013503 [Syzygium grande]|nr:hypothetical protein NL676_013503 [Syzygium grande]